MVWSLSYELRVFRPTRPELREVTPLFAARHSILANERSTLNNMNIRRPMMRFGLTRPTFALSPTGIRIRLIAGYLRLFFVFLVTLFLARVS